MKCWPLLWPAFLPGLVPTVTPCRACLNFPKNIPSSSLRAKPLNVLSTSVIGPDGLLRDTSIALKWFLEDESDRAYSLAILEAITDDYRPVVPWLWYYEIESTILIQVRRKRVVFGQAMDYLMIINEMVSM
jgi:hypothetical protein